MNLFGSMLPTILVLGVLILIHEFGHFLACRMLGVKVEKFSIGFGPEIFHWQGKETRYAISLLPLGGFVKPFGESLSDLPMGEQPKPGDYMAAPIASRMVIVSAGVVMNYVLAFFIFWLVFVIGRPVLGTTIGGFVDGYSAQASGLMRKDKIVEVNHHPVKHWMEVIQALDASPEGPVELSFIRSEETLTLSILAKTEEIKDPFGKIMRVKRLGIKPYPEDSEFKKLAVVPAAKAAAWTVIDLAGTTYKALFYLMAGKLSLKAMSGPIGIISMTGDAAKQGVPFVLQLMASLSVSLAVINLFPVPALDGGHLFFLIIEAFRRKRLSLEFQDKANQVGFVLLLGLMGFMICNDVVNLDIFGKIKLLF